MYHNASVAHWLNNQDKKKIIPQQVDIDLTNKCNQDCYYCISRDFREREKSQYSIPDYMELIEKLDSWRAHTPNSFGTLYAITFAGGGEPTLIKNYEKVIEKAIDCGFLVSLTTNGVRLNHLIENISTDKLKHMNWIGIDIDAYDENTYETIRRSKNKGMFDKVVKNATILCDNDINVDFKILADIHNTSKTQIEGMFKLGEKVGIRMIYYRPVILNNTAFNITPEISMNIKKYSAKYQVNHKINLTKNEPRNYKKCHQMFQFPSFCADGKIYTCCDHKGDSRFEIGSWIDGDFRDNWLNDRHFEVYNNINTHLCPPCRPNISNNDIQSCLDNPLELEILNV